MVMSLSVSSRVSDVFSLKWWWNRKSFMMFCWMLLASTSNEGLPDVPTVKVFLIADLTR